MRIISTAAVLLIAALPVSAQHGHIVHQRILAADAVVVRPQNVGCYPLQHGHGYVQGYQQQVFFALPVSGEYLRPYVQSATDAYQLKAMLRAAIREELHGVTPDNPVPFKDRGLPTPKVELPKDDVKLDPGSGPKKSGLKGKAQLDTETPADLRKAVVSAYSGRANCVNCHGGTGKDAGGLKLVVPTGDPKDPYHLVLQDSFSRSKIYAWTATGIMPPEASGNPAKGTPPNPDAVMESKHLPALTRYMAQRLSVD